jgi:hypothetical protein
VFPKALSRSFGVPWRGSRLAAWRAALPRRRKMEFHRDINECPSCTSYGRLKADYLPAVAARWKRDSSRAICKGIMVRAGCGPHRVPGEFLVVRRLADQKPVAVGPPGAILRRSRLGRLFVVYKWKERNCRAKLEPVLVSSFSIAIAYHGCPRQLDRHYEASSELVSPVPTPGHELAISKTCLASAGRPLPTKI